MNIRILFLPSGSKTVPLQGSALDLPSLTFPKLTGAHRVATDKLVAASRGKSTLSALGVGKRVFGGVHTQRNLYDMPCIPTRPIYTDVLYEVVQLQPEDDVWIFSALFGLTRTEDLIPTYHLNMSITLPRLGQLSVFWERGLASLEDEGDAYVDMRSTSYQVWGPSSSRWKIHVTDTTRRAISHRTKHYRGLLTHALLNTDSSDIVVVAERIGRVNVESGGTCFRILTFTVK